MAGPWRRLGSIRRPRSSLDYRSNRPAPNRRPEKRSSWILVSRFPDSIPPREDGLAKDRAEISEPALSLTQSRQDGKAQGKLESLFASPRLGDLALNLVVDGA
jgi:hypothetical protein